MVGPAYYAAIQGGPTSGPIAGASDVMASWDGGEITRGEAIRMQEDSQRLLSFYSTLVTNAVTFKTKDFKLTYYSMNVPVFYFCCSMIVLRHPRGARERSNALQQIPI